jgi:Ca2+-binding RTX toxin-like protein
VTEFSIRSRLPDTGPNRDNTPGLNSYNFFSHEAIYSLSGTVGSNFYTSVYNSVLVQGSTEIGGPYFGQYTETLQGNGLTVNSAAGLFDLTGGILTSFSTGATSFVLGGPSASKSATGFSMSAATFWDLTLAGQWHDIWLLATSGHDTFRGSNVAGNSDFIEGGGGSDTIDGWAGNDQLWGNAGPNYIYGGEGSDTVVCTDWAAGGASSLWSAADGGFGDDYIFTGGYGSGHLTGSFGDDRMWGGPQEDLLNGGDGIDYMAGGLGRDVFEITSTFFGEYDFILDFQDGVDFIKLPVGAAWAMSDSEYGVWLQCPTSSFGVLVSYATVATLADQIYYA